MLVNVITINEVTSLIIEGRNLMSHVQTFHELYERVAKQIITSGEEWKKFLGFSSQLYKYSFPEKLETGVILFEDLSDCFSVRQLFDYRQTIGSEIAFPDWSISSEQAQKIIEIFHEKTFSNPINNGHWDIAFYDLIDYATRYYAQQDTKNFINQDQHILFITESVNYVIGQKIDSFRTISDDFVLDQITQYKTGIELNSIGVVVSEVSQKMLQHIYSIHQQLQKEEEKRHEQVTNTAVQSEGVRSTATG